MQETGKFCAQLSMYLNSTLVHKTMVFILKRLNQREQERTEKTQVSFIQLLKTHNHFIK